MTNLPKRLTNPKKETKPYTAPVKALSNFDEMKIKYRLSKRKFRERPTSLIDEETTKDATSDVEDLIQREREANKRPRQETQNNN